MAVLGLAVAIPATLLITGGGGDSTTAGSAQTVQPLGEQAVGDPQLGVRVNPPTGWSASESSGVITLTSPDRTVRLAISAPAAQGVAGTVLADATTAVKNGYEDVTAVPGTAAQLAGKDVGGLPAQSAALEARTHGGTQLRILLSAASGRTRTYLVELFTASDAPADRLAEAQLALRTLGLDR